MRLRQEGIKILIAVYSETGEINKDHIEICSLFEHFSLQLLFIFQSCNVSQSVLLDNVVCKHIVTDYQCDVGKIHKISFTYAQENSFDLVTIVEQSFFKFLSIELNNLITPFFDNDVDCVIGNHTKTSRFGITKIIQKQIFNRTVNDFYSKIAIYSVKFLKNIPFILNSNNRFFEAEIRVQILLANAKIIEIFLSKSLKLKIDVKFRTIFLLLRSSIHSAGIFYQRKFDVNVGNEQYDLKMGYFSSHTLVISEICENSSVLDIGSGPLGLAKWLVKKRCSVVSIDKYDISDKSFVSKHIIADADFDEIIISGYDYILLLDIIEHLKSPEQFLRKLSVQFTSKQQKIIITVPNIGFLPIRVMLLLGVFNYGNRGILDHTHTRLFTFNSIRRLLKESNLRINKVYGIPAPYPKSIKNYWVSRVLLGINIMLIKVNKRLFSYQIFIEAFTSPSEQYFIERINDESI